MFLSDKFNSNLEKVIKIFLPIVFILPFYVQSDYYFPFITPRNFLFRILISVLFATYVFLVIRNKKKYKPSNNKVVLSYIAFAVIMTLSSVINGDFMYSLWGNAERMEGLISTYYLLAFFALLLGLYSSKKAWLDLVRISSFVSLIISFLALSQHLGIDLLLASAGGDRVSATLGNPTYLATYSLIHMFLLAYLFFKDKSRRLRLELFAFYAIDLIMIYLELKGRSNAGYGILTVVFTNWILALLFLLPQVFLNLNYYFYRTKEKLVNYSYKVYIVLAIILNFLALFNTQTRGALVGLFVGVLVSLIFLLFSKEVLKKWKLIILAGLLVVVVFSASIFTFKESSFVKNNSTLHRIANVSLTSITVESRLLTWEASYKGFKEKPILGWGEEKFYIVFNKYFPTDIFQDIGSRVWFDRPHNVFIQHLVNGGILGLLAYLSIFVFAFVNLFKHYRKTRDPKTISILSGLLVAYLVQNFFVFDSINSYVPLLLVLAITIFISSKAKEKNIKPKDYSNNRLLVGAISFLVIIVVGYSINIPQMMANRNFIKTFKTIRASATYNEDLNNELIDIINSHFLGKYEYRQEYSEYAYTIAQDSNLSLFQRGKTVELAESEMLKSIEEQPDNVRSYSFLVNLYLAGALLDPVYAQKNIPLIEKSLELSPGRTQLYYSLGRAYMTTKDFDNSIANFVIARDLSPKVFESHLNLIAAYLTVGKLEEAEQARQFMEDNMDKIYPGNYSHLAEAYVFFDFYDQAIDIIKKASEEYPYEAKLYAQLVIYYMNLDDKETATSYYEKILELDPTLAQQVKVSFGL